MAAHKDRALGLVAGLALAVLGVLVPAASAASRTYRISRVAIEARLEPDGSLRVRESRTYEFTGRYHFAFRTLPLRGGVAYDSIRVAEAGRAYAPAGGEAPGTFRVTETEGHLEVRWHFDARGPRTFDLSYRLTPAAHRYQDAAVLYFQAIGNEWDLSNRNVQVKVIPPAPVTREEARAWLHGPLWGVIEIDDQGALTARCERVPPHTLLEIRALYPPALLATAPIEPALVRDRVMEEEARWAEEANLRRAEARRREAAMEARRALGWRLLPLLALAGLAAWFVLWRSRGGRPDVPESASLAMTAEPPSATPPAFVGYLLHNREVTGADLVATLFDLARRGFLVLEEGQRDQRQLFGGRRPVPTYTLRLRRDFLRDHETELLPYEAPLLRFLFDDLAAGRDAIDLDALKKRRGAMTRFYARWSRQVKEAARTLGYFDRASVRGMYASLAIGLFVLLLAVPAGIFLGPPAVIPAAAGVAIVLLSLLIPHRTAAGEQEARRWQGLKRYLKRFGAQAGGPEPVRPHLDALLVYAVVLGLGPRVLRALTAGLSPEEAHVFFPWYFAGSGGGGADGFAAAFSSMVSAATSTVSSASGAGGGAGGGGGGAG